MMRGFATRTAAPKATTPAASGAKTAPKATTPAPDTSQVRAMSRSTPSPAPKSRLTKALSNIPKFKAENYEELIDYLLDEGFASNEENANVILTHMSDEWIESLIEE